MPLLGGCYAYQPSEVGSLNSGDQVRALLTATQFDELEEHLPGGDREIEGEVVEVRPDSILLEVPVLTAVRGIRVQSYNQRFRIPVSGVADLELRTLDRNRTFGVTGLATILIGAVVYNQFFAETGQTPTDPTPPPPEDRRARFVIPLIVW